MMEYDIHTVLDGLTLVATSAVLYAMLATPVKNTYQADLDSVRFYYVVVPCFGLALLAHPYTSHWLLFRVRGQQGGAARKGRGSSSSSSSDLGGAPSRDGCRAATVAAVAVQGGRRAASSRDGASSAQQQCDDMQQQGMQGCQSQNQMHAAKAVVPGRQQRRCCVWQRQHPRAGGGGGGGAGRGRNRGGCVSHDSWTAAQQVALAG
jgi:hypothetical protein